MSLKYVYVDMVPYARILQREATKVVEILDESRTNADATIISTYPLPRHGNMGLRKYDVEQRFLCKIFFFVFVLGGTVAWILAYIKALKLH